MDPEARNSTLSPKMKSTSNYFEYSTYQTTLAYLQDKLPQNLKSCKLGVVCGSGLGGLVECFDQPPLEFHYVDIPHFKHSTVPGHVGKLVFGMMNSIPTVCKYY